jgi:hypothetical protein
VAAEDLLHVHRLLVGGPEALDELARAVGQAGVHVEGGVGAGEDLLDHGVHALRRALPTELRLHRDDLQARLVDLLPGVGKAPGHLDLAVLQSAALAVAGGVQRPEHLGRQAIGLLERGIDLVRTPGLEGTLAQHLAQLELLEEDEADVPQVSPVPVGGVAHAWSPARGGAGEGPPDVMY